ncbi:MAG: hypothetical protein AB1578_12450 [Thermodesulfobacteriota bacterium]
MNYKRVLFAVPVYRESERAYYARLDAEDERRFQVQVNAMANFISDHSPSSEASREIVASVRAGRSRASWRYNRIVGWIEFYSDHKTIKADLWLAREKRVAKNFKNVTIEYKGKIADVCFAHTASNLEISAAIASFMVACQNGAHSWNATMKYTLDQDSARRNLPFLDFCGLMGQIENDMENERCVN